MYQWRECWNDLLYMKFEEPTSNTGISGKTTNDKTLQKNYNITHFEIKNNYMEGSGSATIK